MYHQLVNWTSLMYSSGRVGARRRLRCVGAVCVGLSALVLAGCAASASDGDLNGDLRGVPAAPTLSTEQCAAGAEIRAASENDAGYQIQPGDQLDVEFYLNPEFNDTAVVRPDGKITLRLVGDVQAAGLTPVRLAEHLNKDYLTELRAPGAAVHVKNMPSWQVYVEGEVTKPGSLPLAPGMTVLQAIANTGGLTPDANDTAVLIRRDVCGLPHGLKVNLHSAMNSPAENEDVALMARDILVVPPSTIANVDRFVDHYIRKVVPITVYFPLPL